MSHLTSLGSKINDIEQILVQSSKQRGKIEKLELASIYFPKIKYMIYLSAEK